MKHKSFFIDFDKIYFEGILDTKLSPKELSDFITWLGTADAMFDRIDELIYEEYQAFKSKK